MLMKAPCVVISSTELVTSIVLTGIATTHKSKKVVLLNVVRYPFASVQKAEKSIYLSPILRPFKVCSINHMLGNQLPIFKVSECSYRRLVEKAGLYEPKIRRWFFAGRARVRKSLIISMLTLSTSIDLYRRRVEAGHLFVITMYSLLSQIMSEM